MAAGVTGATGVTGSTGYTGSEGLTGAFFTSHCCESSAFLNGRPRATSSAAEICLLSASRVASPSFIEILCMVYHHSQDMDTYEPSCRSKRRHWHHGPHRCVSARFKLSSMQTHHALAHNHTSCMLVSAIILYMKHATTKLVGSFIIPTCNRCPGFWTHVQVSDALYYAGKQHVTFIVVLIALYSCRSDWSHRLHRFPRLDWSHGSHRCVLIMSHAPNKASYFCTRENWHMAL